MTKVCKKEIRIGNITLPIFISSDGQANLSLRQVTRVIEVHAEVLKTFLKSKDPEATAYQNHILASFPVNTGGSIRAVSIDLAIAFWASRARKGNLLAKTLLATIGSNPVPPFEKYKGIETFYGKATNSKNKKSESNNSEREVVKRLLVASRGKLEIITPAGRIDLLTDTEIVEAKETKKLEMCSRTSTCLRTLLPQSPKKNTPFWRLP